MLPEPALSLTIPSVHDGNVLDCRIYHPRSLSANPRAPEWQRHAAILAHPYAPLGGCFDDPVLGEVAGQLLRAGFLVALFNFRGASGSAGHTSWSAKPEGADYTSVVGFVVYYVHYLDPFRAPAATSGGHLDAAAALEPRSKQPTLIIGGYSYGAVVAMQVPTLHDILQHFATTPSGDAAAQIRLRAQHLAKQYNEVLRSAREAMKTNRNRSYGSTSLRVGGDEDPGSPRRSTDGERRSFSLEAEEKFRRGLHDIFKRHRAHDGEGEHAELRAEAAGDPSVEERLSPLPNLIIPRSSFLLISPPQGVVKHLVLMDFWSSAGGRTPESTREHADDKLVRNPTLAIYGNRDGFVAASKSRAWAARLSSQEGSRFTSVEIDHAGHFWVEEGVLTKLKEAVQSFAATLLAQ